MSSYIYVFSNSLYTTVTSTGLFVHCEISRHHRSRSVYILFSSIIAPSLACTLMYNSADSMAPFLTFNQTYRESNILHKYYHRHAAKYVGASISCHLLFTSLFSQGSKPCRVAWIKWGLCSETPTHPRGRGKYYLIPLKEPVCAKSSQPTVVQE